MKHVLADQGFFCDVARGQDVFHLAIKCFGRTESPTWKQISVTFILLTCRSKQTNTFLVSWEDLPVLHAALPTGFSHNHYTVSDFQVHMLACAASISEPWGKLLGLMWQRYSDVLQVKWHSSSCLENGWPQRARSGKRLSFCFSWEIIS